jgi:hypothetical protein
MPKAKPSTPEERRARSERVPSRVHVLAGSTGAGHRMQPQNSHRDDFQFADNTDFALRKRV